MSNSIMFGLIGLSVPLCAAGLASAQSFENEAAFLANVTAPVLEDFEGFASGELQPSIPGILALKGEDDGQPVDVFVTSDADLPFPMFTAGTLPSGSNFLSNDLDSATFATGKITIVFEQPAFALGFFVADGGPLDNFRIELFDDSGSLGVFDSSSPLSLPNSFFGVVSDSSFTSARIGSISGNDSWGIDNLYFSNVPAPSAAATLAGLGLIAGRRRR
ncbi:MAG: hypothetical protein AAF937_10365 [Planctomycetota bacterium]